MKLQQPVTPLSNHDDPQLLPRLLAGEQQAYRELVQRYSAAMRAVAFAIVGQRHVDDVVQEAWLAIVRSLGGFQCRSSLKTWMLTITANAAKSRYLQTRREQNGGAGPVLPGNLGPQRSAPSNGGWSPGPLEWHEDTPEALLDEEHLRCCMEQTLGAMPGLQRQVLLLRERQGLELEVIAEQLAISLTNARVLLHRGRLKLFAAIERYQAA
ncbi:RNA polymerase sigma factor [Pseudomonas protegens]|uniref:RNA polymerase sigma factor n=1 Tax=Pseudomonas protegens TaxID=380021 RepID=UPI00274F2698|nr:RNA polymerase sigma factor [Pseudomonas protegens]MDP9506988.1 RNA polymerase sigma factor [Pseudomonas protegens]